MTSLSTALRSFLRNQWAVSLILGAGIIGLGVLLLSRIGPVKKKETSPTYSPTASADSSGPISSSKQLVGYWGVGPSGEVAVDGQFAYVNSGSNLEILDVSDPKRLLHIGRTSLSGPVVDVELEGEHAYVVTNHIPIAGAPHEAKKHGLEVVDVSDPTSPQEVGVFETSGVARKVAVSRDFAFVADGRDGLRVIDVSAPNRLRETTFLGSSSNAIAIEVSKGLAYLAGGPEGLWILDAELPSVALDKLGRYNPGGHVVDVTVTGDYALAVVRSRSPKNGRTSDVRVVDVSDSSSPQEVGGFGLSGRVWHLSVTGDRVYVSVRGSLLVFDISNPARPRSIDTLNTEVSGLGPSGEPAALGGEVVASGQYAYLASNRYPRGLYVVNLADRE
jgi:hypothetical protein